MDKYTPEINPTNLKGTVVNTVHNATVDEKNRAAEEEKEKKQDYYVDPLEQDALMKEKLDKIEADKADKKDGDEEHEAYVDETIRPDMNVSGYFSSGTTAKKTSFMSRPASANTLFVCFILGVINAIYSAFYAAALITTRFNAFWFFGWIYAVVVLGSLIITLTSIRSLKVQKSSMKRHALIAIVGSGISIIPLIAYLIHWITAII